MIDRDEVRNRIAIAKPANVEQRTLNSFKLARLAMCEGLTHWERKFVRDLTHRRRLSFTQLRIFSRLVEDYLEGNPS